MEAAVSGVDRGYPRQARDYAKGETMSKFTTDVPAGPIWNNDDAKEKCPTACASHLGEWNGQWTTVVEGKMSVCGCTRPVKHQGASEFTIDIPAGPIWNNDDAKEKCPIICAAAGE